MSFLGAQYGFLLPGAFIAAMAAGSLLLIYAYLRRGKSKRISVASTMFLKFLESIPKARSKFFPPWRFFLELLLLLLLAGAAAGFYIKNSGNRTAIILDNSASMQTIASGSLDRKNLFEAALERVKAELLNARWNNKYNIYITSPALTSLTDGYVTADSAEKLLEKAKPGYFRDNLQTSIEKLFQDKDFNKLFVATDKSIDKDQITNPDLNWVNVKSAADKSHYANLAISNLRLSKSNISDDTNSLEVSIQSYGEKPLEAQIKLFSCASFEKCKSPRSISERTFQVNGGSSTSLTFDNLPPEDLAYYLELQDAKRPGRILEDSLNTDNNAWITSKNTKSKILLVSDESSERLGLNAILTLDVTRVSPADYPQFAKSEKIKDFNSVLFHRYVPAELPNLNIIFVTPPDNKFFSVEKAKSGVQVSRWKTGHPLLSYINLAALNFSTLTPLKIPDVLEPLINTPQGPAAFVGELNGKRMTAFGFELFPYEGKRSPLLSILTLNVFKWISEISSESGFQRIDYPIHLEKGTESIINTDGRKITGKYADSPSLLQLNYIDKTYAVQAVRFYNPEESNTFDAQEVKLSGLAPKASAAKTIGETLSSTIVQGAMLILLIDLILQIIPRRGRPGRIFSLSNFLRAGTVALLILSLINPQLENKKSSSKAYVLLDISDSNDEAKMQEELDRVLPLEAAGVNLNFIPFSGKTEAGTVSSSSASNYRSTKLAWSRLNIGESNIEAAFRSMEGSETGSIILLSDGFQTKGDIASALPELKQAGFKVFPFVSNESLVQKEALAISNLHAPLIARKGKSVGIKVSIENSTTSSQTGKLELKHGDKTLFSKSVTISAGREEVFESQSDPSEDGIKEITAIFRPDNKQYATSSRTIYLSGEKGEKVLLLNGTTDDQRFLKPVLESQSYQLKNYLAGDSMDSIGELKDYSTVILNNIPLNQVPKNLVSAMQSYVQSGGSFVMIGGNKSFGLGGYINSPIEDILPVEMLPPQKEEKRLNVAVQLLIDKSRSMADGNRIDFAKEAAIEVVDNLKDEDYLGVMGFDVNPFVVIRLARMGQIRDEATRRIGLLYPNKGTSLVASIDEGRRDLIRANAGRKHMLILTDGEITDAPKSYYFEMVKQVRLLGITVSTVMLGSEGDESMLKEMANLGGGAFYRTNDAHSLPKIFINDLKVASGERTLKEENEYQVREGPAGVLSTHLSNFPVLKGYVQSHIKSKANLELVTYSESKADPLLASWSYGSGKSIAFTSDANGRWSQSWIDWPKFQSFWTDILESLRGTGEQNESQVRFDLKTYYENAILNFDLSVFSELERASAEAELILPDGSKKDITLKSIAPGRYLYGLENPKAGKYEFRGKLGSKQLTPVAFNLSGELLGEIKGQGYNMPLLRNLADSTGGKFNPAAEDLKKQEYITVTKKDLSQIFMALALLLFLFEILWREVLSMRRPKRKILYSGSTS
jgi:Ca-activated chloride channel family protein